MQYIIGDVHGCVNTLQKLLDKINKQDKDVKIVFVGDYLDRGLYSKQSIDLIIQLPNTVCLRGNHDDVVDWLLTGTSAVPIKELISYPTESRVLEWWLPQGLIETFNSYGLEHVDMLAKDVISAFRDAVPESHKQFINKLPLYWSNDTHFACHGFMRPDMDLPRDFKFMKSEYSIETLWSRFRGEYGVVGLSQYIQPVWDKVGVFGHTPTSIYNTQEPIKHNKIRLIDTGSFLGNTLTAYCCETDSFISEPVDNADLK